MLTGNVITGKKLTTHSFSWWVKFSPLALKVGCIVRCYSTNPWFEVASSPNSVRPFSPQQKFRKSGNTPTCQVRGLREQAFWRNSQLALIIRKLPSNTKYIGPTLSCLFIC
ncbi:hypothetical protein Pelo_15661 [Pelomyxa schiedti]|nr:hypothetical protein Pelo_15661 [Pelomyxa schiedti]